MLLDRATQLADENAQVLHVLDMGRSPYGDEQLPGMPRAAASA
jgi:hypothetical protein